MPICNCDQDTCNDRYFFNSLTNKRIENIEKKWINQIRPINQPNHINGKSADLEIPEKTTEDD